MAKSQPKKKSSPVMWLAIVGGVAAAYLYLSGGDDTKATAKPTTQAKKKAGPGTYTAQDIYAAAHPFDPLKTAVVDAFKPAVIRGGSVPIGDKSFPNSLGGPGWTYSGMAVVDGVSEGELENNTTGEHVFLHRGDKWHAAKAGEIYADHMVFNSPDGPVTVSVEEKETKDTNPPADSAPTTLPAAPVQVPMAGPIGVGDTNLSIVQDSSAVGGPGIGRRRRRNGR